MNLKKEHILLKQQIAPSNAVDLKNAMMGSELNEMIQFVESRTGVFGCDLVTSTDVSKYLRDVTGRTTFTPHRCGKLLSLVTDGKRLNANMGKQLQKVWCLRGAHEKDRGVDRYNTWINQRIRWLEGKYDTSPPPPGFDDSGFDFS